MSDCRDIWGSINADTIKDEFEDSYREFLEDVFEDSVNYNLVYKNLNYVNTYKALIMNYNTDRYSIGVKKIVSYPYSTIQFDIGDYIHWSYGGSQKTWLITSLDKQFTYNVNGRIERCNNNLKWVDSYGNTRTYPCIIEDKINETAFDFKKPMYLPGGTIFVKVQKNTYTESLDINDRFIFDGQAFKVEAVNNFVDGNNIIKFTMFKDIDAEDDDFSSSIANADRNTYTLSINQADFEQSVGYTNTLTATLKLNGIVSSETLVWSSSDDNIATIDDNGVFNLLSVGSVTFTCAMDDNSNINDAITITVSASPSAIADNRISPQITNILQNNTQIYTVYQYVNDVANASTFTYSVSGADVNKYTFTNISGNSFSVKSLGYDSTKLTVVCTNATDATQVTIEIQLKGLF